MVKIYLTHEIFQRKFGLVKGALINHVILCSTQLELPTTKPLVYSYFNKSCPPKSVNCKL